MIVQRHIKTNVKHSTEAYGDHFIDKSGSSPYNPSDPEEKFCRPLGTTTTSTY